MTRARLLSCLVVLVIAGLLPGTSEGAGFALFEHGARGVAMGGAFGATADDPTAGYYNPAGLAFQAGTHAAGGAYFIQFGSTLKGDNPYPGKDYRVEQEDQIHYPMHAYFDTDISNEVRFGVAVTVPFGLGTWWPDDFAGRYVTKRTDVKVFNLNPNIAYRAADNLAIAVGLDYYVANVDLTKSIGIINPYTQSVAEVGQAHIYTDAQTGLGWNAGFLAKLGRGISIGVAYRSPVRVNMDGKASFVQFPSGNADFDAIVATQIPFDRNPNVTTSIKFPDELRLAAAWQWDNMTVEADVVRQGWSSFKELPVTIEGYARLSSVRPENYHDSSCYRIGVEWRKSEKIAYQFGALYDETPVPTESVSPLLPDADRRGLSVGIAWALTAATRLDIGYLHLMFPERSTKGLDGDNFNGRYQNQAELLGFTLVHRF
jgi:long-chain fatty acid transport protein